MDGVTIDGMGGFHQGFADSGMGVDGSHQLGHGGFQADGQGAFNNQIGSPGTGHVQSQNFASSGIGYVFDDPVVSPMIIALPLTAMGKMPTFTS